MGHKVKVNGTTYEVKGGKTKVNGTGYSIKGGKTRIGGTGYNISFQKTTGSLPVGTSVYTTVFGVRTEFIIVHQGNPSPSIYSDSCNGTWVLAKRTYTSDIWGVNDLNDYANSYICSYFDVDFFDDLSTSARNAIKEVKIPYRPDAGTSPYIEKGENGLITKVFALSGSEVGLDSLLRGEGAKLDYFENGETQSALNKRIVDGDWWLRTPDCTDETMAYFIDVFGRYMSEYCSFQRGYRPAFILKPDTPIDDNFNF